MSSIILEPNRSYPSIPHPGDTLESHTATLGAIVEAIQIHERRGRDILDSFVRVGELQQLNLVQVEGDTVRDTAVDESIGHHHDELYDPLGTASGTNLGDLADVDLTGVVANDLIYFNGVDWVDSAGAMTWDGSNFSATNIGGITEANLLDKSASETISGAWDFTANPVIETATHAKVRWREGAVGTFAEIVQNTSDDFIIRPDAASGVQDLFWNSATGRWEVETDFLVQGALTATSYGGITEANLLDKSTGETITANWVIDVETGGPHLHVKGGSVGSALARFQRDIAADAFVEINAKSGEPQILFDRALGTNQWTIGIGSGDVFVIADSDAVDTNNEVTITNAGNISATSFGGIAEANLVDKSAGETISNEWIFSKSRSVGIASIKMRSAGPFLFWEETDAPVDNGGWHMGSATGDFFLRGHDDAGGNLTPNVLQVTRTGTTIDRLIIGPDTEFLNEVRVPGGGSQGDPQLTFTNDLDTGMYSNAANVLSFSIGGDRSIFLNAGWVGFDHPLLMSELSTASGDVAGRGQFWVKNYAPCIPMYTDDVGNDYTSGFAEYRLYANSGFNMSTNSVAQGFVNGAWYSDNATAYTLTLEPSTDTQFPVGAQMTIWNEGSGNLNVTEGTGTTLYVLDGGARVDSGGTASVGQGGFATLIRKSTTVYLLMGAGVIP